MVKRIALCFICLSLFFPIPGCKKTPTSPDIPAVITPTVQTIVIHSNSALMYIGTSETFTATATMSNGSTKAVVGGVWSGDNLSVATIDASTALVTIIGSGTINVFVDYEGKRGTKNIRGLPNYQGAWSGSYVIATCIDSGDFTTEGFCTIFPKGVALPIELNLTQSEDRVDGYFLLGALGADGIGSIQTDGQLLLTGSIQEGIFTLEVAMLLQSTTPGEITGALNQLWRASGYLGNAQLGCDIQELSRISTVATMRRASRIATPTLDALLRALLRR